MEPTVKETTDEIFITMQSVLHLLHNRVYLFDYQDVVACAPARLRHMKENTFLRWFNNPLWTIQNKTVWFDWGMKRPFMAAMSAMRPASFAAAVIGFDAALVSLGLEFMVKFHRIHCMGYKQGILGKGVARRDERKRAIRQCFQLADSMIKADPSPDGKSKVHSLYCEFLTAMLHEECHHRGYEDYYHKSLEKGQKYIIHVPRQVIAKRGGTVNSSAFSIEGLFKNSQLPGEYMKEPFYA